MKKMVYFQWLPGTLNENTIVNLQRIFEDDGEIYYEFNTGDICSKSLIAECTYDKSNLKNKALVRISAPNNGWCFEKNNVGNSKPDISNVSLNGTTDFEVPTYEDFTGKRIENDINYIAPNNKVHLEPIDEESFMSVMDDVIEVTPALIEKEYETEVTKDTYNITEPEKNDVQKTVINNINDPVAILVNSSSKHESSVTMELNIDLPAKSLFNIAKDNFDDGANKFIDVILNSIDYKCVKDSLRDALLAAYSNNE